MSEGHQQEGVTPMEDTTPGVGPTPMEDTNGGGVMEVEESQNSSPRSRFIDENGRRLGKVLWYNTEKKFGFIIPEDPGARILKVTKNDLVSDSDEDTIRALQRNQIVKYNTDDISAQNVKTFEESPVDFTKKIKDRPSPPPGAMMHQQQQWNGGGPPQNPGHPQNPQNSTDSSQPQGPPQLKVDENEVVKGKVVHWVNEEGWGFIQPDGEYQKIVVERAEIVSAGYPGLDIDLRVQFHVIHGPIFSSVAASDVLQDDGSKVPPYEADFMKTAQEIKPNSEEIHRGEIVFFGGKMGKPYGFIQPEGTEEQKKDAQVFVHISQTRWMPLKENSKVEYKLGTNKKGQTTACCVTGPNGGDLEFTWPKKRSRSQPQVPAQPPAPRIDEHNMYPTYQNYGYAGYRGGGPNLMFGHPHMQNPGGRKPKNSKKRKSPKLKSEAGAPGNPAPVFVCTICNRSMNSESAYNDHLNGRAHRKELKKSGSLTGTIPTTAPPASDMPTTSTVTPTE